MRESGIKRKLLVVATATLLFGGMTNLSHGYASYAPPASTIKLDQPITLTVHKYTAPAGDSDSGGKETSSIPDGAKMVDGVEFTWQKVDNSQINLMTNQGWVDAAKIAKKFNVSHDTAELKKDEERLTYSKTGKGTTSNGQIKFSLGEGEDAIGLYLITETDTSKAKVDGAPANVTPALPFLVTLPMTDPGSSSDAENARTTWNYNVHVYPKNAVVKITKEVDDGQTVAKNTKDNSKIYYYLKADIPLRTGAKSEDAESVTPLDKYVVMDKFNPDQVTLVEEGTVVRYCVPTGGQDICEAAKSSEYDKTVEDGLFTVTFKDEGLKTLAKKRFEAESNTGSKQAYVKVDLIVTLVGDVPEGTTTSNLDNTAYLVPDNNHGENLPPDPNDPSKPGKQDPGKTPPIPSNKVTSKFAKVKLKKVDEEGNGLGGAEFQLFTCELDDVDPDKVTVIAQSDRPIKIGDQPVKATSNEKGEVLFDQQVRVSDFTNNEKLEDFLDENYKGYCVKEVKAPEGYELTPEFIPVNLKADEVTVGVYTLSDNVVNVKKNAGFKLPFTGSAASISLMLAAVALMGGAIVLASRRRRDEES